MSLLNQILDGRYNTFLRAKFLDEQSGVETLAPELQPVFIAEGERLEHALLKDEKVRHGVMSNTSGVGTDVFLQFLNPVGSGVLAVVHEVWFTLGAAGGRVDWLFGVDTAIGALATDLGAVDRRPQNEPLTSRSPMQLRSLVAAPGIGNLFHITQCGATLTQHVFSRMGALFVLGPGRAIVWESLTDSTAFILNVRWSERAARPSELG